MKKLFLVLSVAAVIGLTSCNKCGTCTGATGTLASNGVEFCKGNAIEDAVYESEKSFCENNGGTWD